MLSFNDLAISRTHARIIYQDGFINQKRKIPAGWFEFSKLFTYCPRMQHSKVTFLPVDIRRIILTYVRLPRNFFIQDMGSTHGTFIQMGTYSEKQALECQIVEKGHNYLIGSDIYMNILELQLNKSTETDPTLYQEMMKFIANEY